MSNELIGIYLSPSNQVNNKYAYGNTNEAVVCCQIANATEAALNRCGAFRVYNNQTSSMADRCVESDSVRADLHVPIHTNAHNGAVTGTRIFYYSKESKGYKAAHAIFNVLAPLTPGTSENVSKNASLYETRVPKAPTAYIEVDFHDVAEIAKWLIENTEAVGEAICEGICNHFGVEYIPPKTTKYRAVLGEYNTKEEAANAVSELRRQLEVIQLALLELDSRICGMQIVEA